MAQQARNQDFHMAGRLSTKAELIKREINIYAAINAYALLPCTKIVNFMLHKVKKNL